MPRICISYRRSDSTAIVGRIYDRLVGRYGAESIFMDLNDIPYGADFRKHIQAAFQETSVLIAAIGPAWIGQQANGAARIHDKLDPVRVEIQTALRQRILVIPVLVDGGRMPSADDLPRNIKEFSFRNAMRVDSGVDFPLHMERLMTFVDQALGIEKPANRLRISLPARGRRRIRRTTRLPTRQSVLREQRLGRPACYPISWRRSFYRCSRTI
jgi:TIR domain